MYKFIRPSIDITVGGPDMGGKAFLNESGNKAEFKQYYSISDKNFEYIEIYHRAKVIDFMWFYRIPGFCFSQKFNNVLEHLTMCYSQNTVIKLVKKNKILGDYYWHIFNDQSQLVDIKSSIFSCEILKENRFEILDNLSFDSEKSFTDFTSEAAQKAWRKWPTTLTLKKEAAQYDLLHIPNIKIDCLLVSDRLLQKMEENKITGYEIILKDCPIHIH